VSVRVLRDPAVYPFGCGAGAADSHDAIRAQGRSAGICQIEQHRSRGFPALVAHALSARRHAALLPRHGVTVSLQVRVSVT